jgi:hypothetical protein
MSLLYSVLVRSADSSPESLKGLQVPASTDLVDVEVFPKSGQMTFPSGEFRYDRLIHLHIDKERREEALQEVAGFVGGLLQNPGWHVALCFQIEHLVLKRDETGLMADANFNVIRDTRLSSFAGPGPKSHSPLAH